MANVVYVGNYPTTLSDDEILQIFKDFEGLVLLRSIRRSVKCYSFILCRDQEQVIEVVFALNGLDVGGRNLIVRASDDELQEIINQCEYEEEYSNYESYAAYDKGECGSHVKSSAGACESELLSSKTNYRQPRKPSRLTSTDDLICKSIQNRTNSRGSEEEAYCGASVKGNDVDETASWYSYSTSKNGSMSPCSVASSATRRRRRGEKFSFVSIVNFPDGTTVEELREMFADYNPFKIIMQNQISDEDRPTEAAVCFLKGKDATSSILNLDNTLYNGRVILVTECDDTALISDLMKVHHC